MEFELIAVSQKAKPHLSSFHTMDCMSPRIIPEQGKYTSSVNLLNNIVKNNKAAITKAIDDERIRVALSDTEFASQKSLGQRVSAKIGRSLERSEKGKKKSPRRKSPRLSQSTSTEISAPEISAEQKEALEQMSHIGVLKELIREQTAARCEAKLQLETVLYVVDSFCPSISLCCAGNKFNKSRSGRNSANATHCNSNRGNTH